MAVGDTGEQLVLHSSLGVLSHDQSAVQRRRYERIRVGDLSVTSLKLHCFLDHVLVELNTREVGREVDQDSGE